MQTAANSDWKDGFLFLGNELVLDFLNTRPVQDGQPVELLTDFAALLRWFTAANLLSAEEAERVQRQWARTKRAEIIVAAMRDLREKLREEVLLWERGKQIRKPAIEEVNKLLAEHPVRIRLRAKDGKHSTETWFEVRELEDLFAPLAQSAVHLFTGVDPKRVRRCGNCVLHFHDISKKGRRRWCSMKMCGNRVKVAAYAERHRRQADE